MMCQWEASGRGGRRCHYVEAEFVSQMFFMAGRNREYAPLIALQLGFGGAEAPSFIHAC